MVDSNCVQPGTRSGLTSVTMDPMSTKAEQGTPSTVTGTWQKSPTQLGYRARSPHCPDYADPGPFPCALGELGQFLTKCPGWPHPQQSLAPGRVLRAICSNTARKSSVTFATHAGFSCSGQLPTTALTVGVLSL
ncbi:hypothetical protein AAFF_G00070580 [Aldrovandia affinis]|uniref:Uncharacterized protein n=1 Tax=Aldrovandia affinis TaxID=143900 RepID=A0AAD7RYY5_9TELE|nr:hypothetical protein AAFF_G00070580 [Aldrovandia affinis]